MVDSRALHDHAAVRGYVEQICFKTGPPRVVGAELEWLVADPRRPDQPVPIDHLRDVLNRAGPFPGGSTATFEPGGQVELSSPPLNLSACWHAVDADVGHLRHALRDAGFSLVPSAIDPCRQPYRQINHPRYDAMEAYFDRRGHRGRVMMCSTASIQINLDAGADRADVARRWHLLNAVGPAMVAAFANSPMHAGRVTGWKSTRQAVWQLLDPPRTRQPPGPDPAGAWTRYLLDAPLMLLRTGEPPWTPDPGVTFGAWMNASTAGTNGDGVSTLPSLASLSLPPSQDDLDYHLTTLFPPVRPRGWLEIRYVDTQAPEFWAVPVAVLTALVGVPWAGEIAMAAAEPVTGAWLDAARHAMDHPGLARAARTCFDAAVAALPTIGADPRLVALVESFLERYVAQARCPADDARAGTPSVTAAVPVTESEELT
ncbi:ergothioneine biosynthesis glutamate--cysteine ligase EgtA [Actinobacteria bacterium YIM 96077]|uniref:Glutamate--cysteine ligase EgtA n=1 Tax=Phytoactinopolyspora halophila TaxID=1981511 RepID=A0A329QZK2_9ACTN|nr:ergothioneine biosynthesis glutamate--cysteine ligase EgtA [Phytoactinopolyspora halophila]AYY13218.1 ergothioneine biosynthesis glutamate--cysteine ligase EgtA [Actinobacteria bacterium YIM 96077]RAW17543.1 ergothioneine biosynthesis glutamate--cysteine ligase EgtA [Phytoactinopolyspora halophila]